VKTSQLASLQQNVRSDASGVGFWHVSNNLGVRAKRMKSVMLHLPHHWVPWGTIGQNPYSERECNSRRSKAEFVEIPAWQKQVVSERMLTCYFRRPAYFAAGSCGGCGSPGPDGSGGQMIVTSRCFAINPERRWKSIRVTSALGPATT
jgi:hypothetical protein